MKHGELIAGTSACGTDETDRWLTEGGSRQMPVFGDVVIWDLTKATAAD